jgi:protein SCO1
VANRLVAVLLAAFLLAGCGEDTPTEEGYHGAVLDEQYVVPDTALTDTDGQPYSLAADTDKPLTLVFFGYTHCPDICQVVMATIASALTRLDERDRDQVDVAFVTTDPARDDEQTLRTYLDRFDPSFIGLTGELQTIIDVGKPIAVAVEQGEKLPSGGYEVVHSTQVTAIDDQDRVPILWTQGTSASDLADDIHRLLA